MPFQSQSQRRFLYARNPQLAKTFEAHTSPDKVLPERVVNRKPTPSAWELMKRGKNTKARLPKVGDTE